LSVKKTEIMAVGIRHAKPSGNLYPQKLTLTLPTSGGSSDSIVPSRTQVTEFVVFVLFDPRFSTIHYSLPPSHLTSLSEILTTSLTKLASGPIQLYCPCITGSCVVRWAQERDSHRDTNESFISEIVKSTK
jgi:hypothetical protein